MLIRLDPRGDMPVYLQIAESISRHIQSGALKAGERLPAARTLGETLNVNMHTVLKAYSDLEKRGLVEMRRGRGGVVVSDQANVRDVARSLVGAAKRRKMERSELDGLIDEVWG
jgi:GntR family transcriptional regulator